MDDALIGSLRRAIESAPDDVQLRIHLGRLLLSNGDAAEAIATAGALLNLAPENAEARSLMTDALAALSATPPSFDQSPESRLAGQTTSSFNWSAAEEEVGDLAAPMFVGEEQGIPAFDPETPTVTLDDVGGMKSVKDRLNAAFLAPMRNPELRRLYAKSLRGGLLMYGPPGCGKTFMARAIAGELGAKFISIGLADILDPMLGVSEQNVRDAFQLARREAPCVLFLDEIDALGQRRSQTRGSAIRGTVNQLLTELDGIDGVNEGVFVLAATNQPWDVDPALRRPGRLDRTVLVLPPDSAAREAIFRYHLRNRPIEGIDLGTLAKRSARLSGADIAYVCELAAERALMDSVASGTPRMIVMADLDLALNDVKPSTSSWLESARNVVLFGEDDGTYAELKAYLKKANRL